MVKLSYEDNLELLRKEWMEEENGSKMDDYKKTHKAKWKCSKGCDSHIWEATINKREQGRGCPFCSNSKICPCGCNSFARLYPILSMEWDTNKNKLSPEEVVPGSARKVWWICNKNNTHKWETQIRTRIKGCGCPFCTNKKISTNMENSLAILRPELAQEWHPTLNKELKPEHFTTHSAQKIWWKCSKGCENHVWEAVIYSRSNGKGCPFCCNKHICPCGCNSLRINNPLLCLEWHPTLNGELTPDNVSPGSGRQVWWICSINKCGYHIWQTTVNHRNIAGTGCPYCCNRTICECRCNSLEILNPLLSSEWHPTRNGDLTPRHVSIGSGRKVWWLCSRNHKWEATISERSKYSCPHCNSSSGEAIIEQLLDLNNIKYSMQEKISINTEKYMRKDLYDDFRDLKVKKKLMLKFDFYIPDTNWVIEFDGLQHFKPVKHFGGEEQYRRQRLYDKFKNDYCRYNNLRLLRIHYDDMGEIEDLLRFVMRKSNYNPINQVYSQSYPNEFLY